LTDDEKKKVLLLPRVRPELELSEQVHRGRKVYVVKDPVTLRYFRVGEIEGAILKILREPCTLQGLQEKLEAMFDMEFPEETIVKFMRSLKQANIFVTRGTADVDFFMKVRQFKSKMKLKGSLFSFLYFRIPLWDPDSFFNRTVRFTRPFFTKWFLLIWLASVTAAVFTAGRNWHRIGEDMRLMLGGWNLVYFVFSIMLVKTLHEFAHGYTCKHWGGEIHEMGLLFIVLNPCFFCNVSDAWSFKTRFQKLAVTSAGIFFELFVASIATHFWARLDPGFGRKFAYSVMVTCSVSTVVFNANPLLRYDGYYILADLLEIPNLRARSASYLRYLWNRYGKGLGGAFEQVTVRERVIYVVYGICSFLYRWFILIAILILFIRILPGIGVPLAVVYLWTQLVMPIGKGIIKLTRAKFEARTIKRLAAGGALAGSLVAFAMLYSSPVIVKAQGYVSPANLVPLTAQVEGYVKEVLVREGETVEKGDRVAVLDNRFITGKLEVLKKNLAALEIRKMRLVEKNSAHYKVIRESIEQTKAEIKAAEQEVDKLVVTSPVRGTIATSHVEMLVGAYVPKGGPLLEIIEMDRARVGVYLRENQVQQIARNDKMLFKPSSFPLATLETRIETISPSQRHDFPTVALTLAGGGRAPAYEERSRAGRRLRSPLNYYIARGTLRATQPQLKWGMTGKVRIYGARLSLMEKLGRRLKAFGRRVWLLARPST